MTATRYTPRAREARPQLLELMETRARWTDGELLSALALQAPVLQELLSDLTAEGVVRRRFVHCASGAIYSLNASSTEAEHDQPLSPVQQRTHTHLVGRKETLGSIAAALRLPKEEVAEALGVLDDRNLITCAFVGHLAIFSRA